MTMERAMLDEILALAQEAGRAVMAVYQSADWGVDFKADNSPLTLADIASHKVISAGLARLYPEIPLLSEESAAVDYEVRRGWQRFWLVDPLDGTKEFIKRNGEFTVNIALIEQGRPVLGVVVAPVLRRAYFAARGVGAFAQEDAQAARPIQVASRTETAPWRVVASRSHSDARTEAFLARLGNCELTSIGSSLKLCLVAAGEADVYPRFGPTMEWDTAAAQCVVECAGGVVCDLAGGALGYNKVQLLNPPFMVVPGGLQVALRALLD